MNVLVLKNSKRKIILKFLEYYAYFTPLLFIVLFLAQKSNFNIELLLKSDFFQVLFPILIFIYGLISIFFIKRLVEINSKPSIILSENQIKILNKTTLNWEEISSIELYKKRVRGYDKIGDTTYTEQYSTYKYLMIYNQENQIVKINFEEFNFEESPEKIIEIINDYWQNVK